MQKIKRVLKKIGAISTGVAFLGATLTGALAADLADYPSPFVSGGAYSDVAVITSSNGMDANSALLVTNAFAGLITATSTSTGSSTTTVAGAYQLSKSGNKFNFDDDAFDIDSKLDKNDLSVVLADGTFSDNKGDNKGDYDYTQKIVFSDNRSSGNDKTVGLVFDQTDSGDKKLGDYLLISKTSDFYTWTYTLDLSTTLTTANAADLNNNVINILGKDYTIVSSTVTSGNITKMTLLAGEVTQTLKSGETVSGVTLSSVNLDGNKCTVEYDGTTYTIDNGETETMSDGTIIGVTDVVATSAGIDDYCELNIGATKVELQDNQKVKVNGDDIKESKVRFMKGGFDYFNITYRPQDKMYIAPGEEFVDPIFGAFKIMYEGLEETTEDILLSASGDQVTLDTTDKGGNRIFMDLCYTNSSAADMRFGSDQDEQLVVVEGDFITNMSVTDHTSASDVESLEGTKFLYSFSEYAHIVEITDIDTTSNQTDFTVIDDQSGTGTQYNDKDFTPDGTADTFDFLANSFQLNISYVDSKITFTDINDKGPSIFTEYGANITFMGNASYGGAVNIVGNDETLQTNKTTHTCYFTIQEVDTGKETDIPLSRLLYDFTYDTSGKEININTNSIATAAAAGGITMPNYAHGGTSLKQIESGDSTTKGARTYYGTYVEKYVPTGTGEDKLTWKYPDEAVQGLVYVAPLGAEATTITTGTSTSYVALEDTEVTTVSAYNAIVVGGPAANIVAADLLGLEYPSYGADSGLVEGEAIIKLVDNGANVAMVIYGWEQDDTKRAAKVLESYSAYAGDLTGTEVSVTGTSANPTIVGTTSEE